MPRANHCHLKHTNQLLKSGIASHALYSSRRPTPWRRVRRNALQSIGLQKAGKVARAVSTRSFIHLVLRLSGQRGAVESHLATQRAAVKMLHDRIMLLTRYVTEVIAGLFPSTSVKASPILTNQSYRQVRRRRTTLPSAHFRPSSHRYPQARTGASAKSSIPSTRTSSSPPTSRPSPSRPTF